MPGISQVPRVIKVSFVMLMKCFMESLPGYLRMGPITRGTNSVMRGLELSPPDLWGGKRGWRLSQSPVGNNVINHAYVMTPP